MIEVVVVLIWDESRFLTCQRPANKARPLLWELARGKVEPAEVKERALVRECRKELGITVQIDGVFCKVMHERPDLTVYLTLFHAVISSGTPQKLRHNDIHRITLGEIPQYKSCPADVEIPEKIIQSSENIS